MRRALVVTAALALAAAPAALAHGPGSGPGPGPGPTGPQHAKKAPAKAERGVAATAKKGPNHLLHACVVADATSTGVDLRALGGNRHMRRALDGATTLTAALDGDTRVRLVGKARHLPKGSTPKRGPRIGGWDDLDAGDRVIVRFRAARGTAAADLPAAIRVVDRGPVKRCAPAPATPAGGE